ncbi:MAG: hypothetical protein ABMA64_10430, partial [Myxococcota bacterium]
MLPIAVTPTVTLDAQHFRELMPPEEVPAELAPAPMVTRRSVTLQPLGTEQVAVAAEWSLAVVGGPSPISLRLAGPDVVVEEVRIDGEVASTVNGADGTTFVGVLSRDAHLTLRGWV